MYPRPRAPRKCIPGNTGGFLGDAPAPPGNVFVGLIVPSLRPPRCGLRVALRLSSDTLPGGAGAGADQARGDGFSCARNHSRALRRRPRAEREARYWSANFWAAQVGPLRGLLGTQPSWPRAVERKSFIASKVRPAPFCAP